MRTLQVAVSPPRHATSSRRSAINAVLESIDALASASTSAQLDGDFVFKRRRGCVYHAASSTPSVLPSNATPVTPQQASFDEVRQREHERVSVFFCFFWVHVG